jgi:hypothetical protein
VRFLLPESDNDRFISPELLRGLHFGNIKYTENPDGTLKEAHLTNWARAIPAPTPEGPDGQFTDAQKQALV